MGIIALAFISFLAIGLPVAFVLGGTTIIYMFAIDNTALFQSTPQRMFSGLLNYSLLAIPLFVLVGELMNSGGITNRLIHFAKVLLGHFRGGLAYVNVLGNMFLASILGSANAQAAMMSKVMVPAMEKDGYKREFSGAVTVASSLMGPIIPPSLLFILYGVIAETSIAGLFLAGIIPGILLGLAFAVLIYIISVKEDFPRGERFTGNVRFKAFLSVIPSLLIPVIILVSILSGLATATESAAVAALMALIVGGFLYRELNWKDLPKVLVRTATNSAIVTFIVAMANVFGWVLAFERIPQAIGSLLTTISDNPLVFLLLINIFFLLVGMVLDGIASLIILVPILLPIAVSFGVDPIQFGVIVSINLTIGLITPPVGTALFITSSIGEIKFERLMRAVVPFLLVALVVLLIITYVPATTLWIPNLFGY